MYTWPIGEFDNAMDKVQKRRNEVASAARAAQEGNVFRCQAKASVVASGVAAGLAGSPKSARSRPMCGCIRTMIADIQIIWIAPQ